MNPIARRLALVAASTISTVALLPGGTAYAADEATIDASEAKDGAIQMLVSIPGEESIDLDSVTVSIDGTRVEATATSSDQTDAIQRTAVLAIDTSFSMRGDRINAAKRAALAFLDAVPANVRVGIVTFDVGFDVVQKPSLDREASRTVVNGLELGADTALYEGVAGAIDATGDASGQRQVLVLSDGRDNTDAALAPVLAKIKRSEVKIDVVALDQGAQAPQPLVDMAAAGKGTVVAAGADDLEAVFAEQAQTISRQILVSAAVPPGQTAPDANVTVALDSGDTTYETSALLSVAGAITPDQPLTPAVLPAADDGAFDIPKEVMYGALAAIGLGVVVLFTTVIAGSGGDRRTSLAAQLDVYGATAASSQKARAEAAASADFSGLAQQARQAAESMLATNKGFEAKVADRLEGAGMALKASEWLLMHVGIAFLAGILGLLISGGNPVGLLVFLVLGAIGPWVYLSLKRTRRLKAFDANLADTLQLMAGSLSAGLSLAQSMDTIVREGNEPITSEFKRVIAEARLGVPLEDALDGVAVRMQSKDFTWVVMAIRIQREVGGNLAELLLKVANTLREREYIRRHVSALSAEGRLSCWILGGLPPAFLAYLSVTRGDYVRPLFTEPMGWIMLVVMAVLLTVGIFWMSKVAKVEI